MAILYEAHWFVKSCIRGAASLAYMISPSILNQSYDVLVIIGVQACQLKSHEPGFYKFGTEPL